MAPSIAREHAEWLSLLEISGPFLSLPVLLDVFPQGLDAHDPELFADLRRAHEEWREESGNPAIHHLWARFVLTEVLGYPPEFIRQGQELPPGLSVTVPEHGETLRPDLAVVDPDGGKPRVLIQVLPPGADLEKPLPGKRWTATPQTRMMELLHGADVRLGLVTDGDRWMLVDAPRGETTGFISWYAAFWLEERLTLRAFRSLLGARRLFGVSERETLEVMLAASAGSQAEVTDQLGRQVRRAVEIIVQKIDRIDKDRGRTLLAGGSETELYDAALTVMMRLVFLLAAEERGLLALGTPLYDENYAVSTLRALLRETADRQGEEILSLRCDAWSRLLATFRAVHGGISHDLLNLLAYGGTLFDPDRFPFLEGRAVGTDWREAAADPLTIDNRTVLHLLEALQLLQVKVPGGGPAEARLLSFRSLDIEQIGHVYEGLLDHTCLRATDPVLGLAGSKDREPEVPLVALEEKRAKGEKELLTYLKEQTGRGEKALAKLLVNSPDRDEGRLRRACDNDDALLERVRPFAGLLREDSSGTPVVITAGSVYVTESSDRRSTGTHYTPRTLTEPIVRYTLEPLVYEGPAEGKPRDEWNLRSVGEILSLKICDPAMGSGAFLVQACRYLAERLVEAWQVAEGSTPGGIAITPAGDLASGALGEQPLPRDAEERLTMARRIIADRCLYGVDLNPMAVEMAKLSLWLVTLQRNRPFTFLDHALRPGDSLLGVDIVQYLQWNLNRRESVQGHIYEPLLKRAIDHALRLRRKIAELPDWSVADTEEKARLLAEADATTELIRLGGDLLIGAALADKKEQTTVREQMHLKYTLLVDSMEELRKSAWREHVVAASRERMDELRQEADELLRGRHPFHWPFEFPEVFVDPNSLRTSIGFDALLSNPPFVSGKHITGEFGTDYREYLVENLASGTRGHADLCAYFFLRAAELLRSGGQSGMLATNTIAQGDTREVGLEQLVARGWTIRRADPSRKWPGEANLEVAQLWIQRGQWGGVTILQDEPVACVTPYLTRPGRVEGKPYSLASNAGKSFNGSYVLGMGFVLTPEEAEELIDRDPRNRDVLYPYLNGEDLNSRPDQSPSRWVINFHDWPIEKARSYPDCWRIIEEKVRPERQRRKPNGEYALRKPLPQRYWQYAEKRPALYASITGMQRVTAVAATSRTLAFAFCPSTLVYSHATYAFALSTDAEFAVLQSCVHEVWAREYASSMRQDLRYAPSDVFDTFPFPVLTMDMERAGESYASRRSSSMVDRAEGLTKTYKRFHDRRDRSPDSTSLRQLQSHMDYAVADAYGWADLDLGHGFHETKQGIRFTISEEARREVLGRLLQLNHERYAEEVAAGLHEKAKKGAGKVSKRKVARQDGPELFEEASGL